MLQPHKLLDGSAKLLAQRHRSLSLTVHTRFGGCRHGSAFTAQPSFSSIPSSLELGWWWCVGLEEALELVDAIKVRGILGF
jgi:hypothetical protein